MVFCPWERQNSPPRGGGRIAHEMSCDGPVSHPGRVQGLLNASFHMLAIICESDLFAE